MFTIHALNVRDLSYVVANMRDCDWAELRSQLPIGSERKDALQNVTPTMNGPGWSVHYKEQPIAVFGVAQSSIPTLWSAYAFGTNKFKRAAKVINAFGVQHVSHLLIELGALRLEVRANKNHDLANKWLMNIGFTRECELECFGTNGDTFVQYSLTAKDYYRRNPSPSANMQ